MIALIEGEDIRIAAFRQFVETKKPERAEVEEIAIIEYDGDVGRTGEYAMMCSFNQLTKAIPVLLEIRDDIKEMKGDMKVVRRNTDPIPQILEELQPGYAIQFKQMQTDVKAIKERLGMS